MMKWMPSEELKFKKRLEEIEGENVRIDLCPITAQRT
jgi:hypothetical protein